MNILAVIPARGGSKGIKYKNLQEVAGKSLITRAIEASRSSKLVTRTVVSTDDQRIAEVARQGGADVPFLRPDEYATDTAKSSDVAIHAITECSAVYGEEYDVFVLLQPTSPFRTADHIDEALTMLIEDSNADSLISVKEVPNDFNPYYIYRMDSQNYCSPLIELSKIERRQDLPNTYVRNGAIYAVKSEYLLKNFSLVSKNNIGFIMTDHDSVNIDTEFDLAFARNLVWNTL